jgi:hypothetical protein
MYIRTFEEEIPISAELFLYPEYMAWSASSRWTPSCSARRFTSRRRKRTNCKRDTVYVELFESYLTSWSERRALQVIYAQGSLSGVAAVASFKISRSREAPLWTRPTLPEGQRRPSPSTIFSFYCTKHLCLNKAFIHSIVLYWRWPCQRTPISKYVVTSPALSSRSSCL